MVYSIDWIYRTKLVRLHAVPAEQAVYLHPRLDGVLRNQRSLPRHPGDSDFLLALSYDHLKVVVLEWVVRRATMVGWVVYYRYRNSSSCARCSKNDQKEDYPFHKFLST